MPPAKKEQFMTVETVARNPVAVRLESVEQVAYEWVRGVFTQHLVLRMTSGNVAVAEDDAPRVLAALGIKAKDLVNSEDETIETKGAA